MADDDGPFRSIEHGRSTALERLAARHPEAEAIHKVDGLDDIDAIGAAIGDEPPAGCLMMSGYLATFGLAAAWLPGWVPALAIAGGGGVAVLGHLTLAVGRARWRRRAAKAMAWLERLPFPVTGVRGFFAATEPMIDVTFRRPPLLADYAAGVKAHAVGAEALAIDGDTYRLRWPPPPPPADDAPTTRRHDLAWLRRLIDEVLVPLHADVGIERVELGGIRGALPAPAPPTPDE